MRCAGSLGLRAGRTGWGLNLREPGIDVAGANEQLLLLAEFERVGLDDGIALPEAGVAGIDGAAGGAPAGHAVRGDVSGNGREIRYALRIHATICGADAALTASLAGALVQVEGGRGRIGIRVGEFGVAGHRQGVGRVDGAGTVGAAAARQGAGLFEADVAGLAG